MINSIASMIFSVLFACMFMYPFMANLGHDNLVRELDKEDEILHELTACCED